MSRLNVMLASSPIHTSYPCCEQVAPAKADKAPYHRSGSIAAASRFVFGSRYHSSQRNPVAVAPLVPGQAIALLASGARRMNPRTRSSSESAYVSWTSNKLLPLL